MDRNTIKNTEEQFDFIIEKLMSEVSPKNVKTYTYTYKAYDCGGTLRNDLLSKYVNEFVNFRLRELIEFLGNARDGKVAKMEAEYMKEIQEYLLSKTK